MVPYLRAANVVDGRLDLRSVLSMNFTPSEQRIFSLRPGDVLVTEGSGSLGAVGATAVWGGEVPGTVCFQNTLLRLRPRNGAIDGRFLQWWARGAYANGAFASVASGANIHHVSADRVRALPIRVPPVAEQRRIADFLDAETAQIDRIVSLRRNQATLLRERLKVAIAEAILGERGVEEMLGHAPWYGSLPEGWIAVALRWRWKVIDCKHRTPTYIEDGYPIIGPRDVTPGRLNPGVAERFVGEIDYRDLADTLRRCRPGDIVYSRNASSGIASYVDTDQRFAMGQDVCRITSTREDQLFLTYVLNYLVGAQLDAMRIGSTFTRINVDEIGSLIIPVPPRLREQQAVAARCDEVLSMGEGLLDRFARQRDLLKERRTTLITAAVTGQLDPTTAHGVGEDPGASRSAD